MSEQLVICRRFCGFADIALGGYVGGLLAGRLRGPVEVRLRGIVPMERPLEIEHPDSDRVDLRADDIVLAEARRTELDIEVPAPVSLSAAEVASSSYPGFKAHLFPGCFTCGPGRAAGDGLRIFPGRIEGRELVAAPWMPAPSLADSKGSLPAEFVWAALDCPQLWSLITSAPPESNDTVVTAGMTVRVESMPQPGGRYVILAWPMHREGHAIFAGGAILSEEGEPLVTSVQRTVVVSGRGVPVGFQHWTAQAG